MNEDVLTPQWATSSGDVWASRWQDTDRGLSGLAPHLLAAITAAAPARPFRALDVGSGPGSTAIAVAEACPQAEIIACDISPALVELAQRRTSQLQQVRVELGDAEAAARREGPFDLIFSRHGVMFFADPLRAFRTLCGATKAGGALLFSCFRDWALNPWASELASAAADRILPPPGRESGGFAFADPDYVFEILGSAGWSEAERQAVDFQYVATSEGEPVEYAVSFFSEIGPASRIIQSLPDEERGGALERLRGAVERHFDGKRVSFPAAAWIWRAKAAAF